MVGRVTDARQHHFGDVDGEPVLGHLHGPARDLGVTRPRPRIALRGDREYHLLDARTGKFLRKLPLDGYLVEWMAFSSAPCSARANAAASG